jgi:hypothetical protein
MLRVTIDPWVYGECNGRVARRHRRKGIVQVILWKPGEQGFADNFWHAMDSSWWAQFEPFKAKNPRKEDTRGA